MTTKSVPHRIFLIDSPQFNDGWIWPGYRPWKGWRESIAGIWVRQWKESDPSLLRVNPSTLRVNQLAAISDQEAGRGSSLAVLIERGRTLLVAAVPPLHGRRSRGANGRESRQFRPG